AMAVDLAFLNNVTHQNDANPAVRSLAAVFDAYSRNDVKTFNSEVAKYRASLEAAPPKSLNQAKVEFETFFNHFEPFYYAAVLYFTAFVLACFGFLTWSLGWGAPFQRAAFWLILVTLGLHTLALIARIYISGRPPVTNLYSAAVFIGWAAVVLGLVLESVFRLGIGNLIAGLAGFGALLISHFLASSGDTFTVLQAVLDTQFWLATHVVCITLGYATTFVAGLLGLTYIVLGIFTPALNAPVNPVAGKASRRGVFAADGYRLEARSTTVGKTLAGMIYGILCFAIFFSFFGTVLGGLWADDSWGRFWGWDPKENGALIIVIWNALVLHARWDGMVKDRGLAVLAVGGNIATAWSMFGVNELGAGLHSYGFTEGVALALIVFVVSQFAMIALGSLPKHLWRSNKVAA
ncbi:MAG TPA: cytochrome c biogenesis protein CcsA, partial [Pirellulales bacterium]|nr:cytochrome c biogenesis protein CcsA [Pirellulales bacterium]